LTGKGRAFSVLNMARAARIVIPGLPHHVVQRGADRLSVFGTDADYLAYLQMLGQQAQRARLAVLGYCLMRDHVHLVVVPRTSASLAQAIGRTHWLYTQHVNRLRDREGPLWQNRFFSCPLDEAHLADVLLYVERNPMRARQARYPWSYRWSSASAHANATDPAGLLDMSLWRRVSTPAQWRSLLVRPDAEEMVKRIRRATSTGRPLATDSTLDRLERRLGRRLRALPVGRPRKSSSQSVAPKRSRA
jgi:putative transposase